MFILPFFVSPCFVESIMLLKDKNLLSWAGNQQDTGKVDFHYAGSVINVTGALISLLAHSKSGIIALGVIFHHFPEALWLDHTIWLNARVSPGLALLLGCARGNIITLGTTIISCFAQELLSATLLNDSRH